MPYVTVESRSTDNPVYQVGGKSFIYFRTPRPDAVDPDTGERYTDVIIFWVPDESDKQAMVQDDSTPFFTTPHFKGHSSVLLRGSRISVGIEHDNLLVAPGKHQRGDLTNQPASGHRDISSCAASCPGSVSGPVGAP